MTDRPLFMNGRQVVSPFAGGVVRYAQELSRHLQDIDVLEPPERFRSGPQGHAWEQTMLPFRSRSGVLFSPANFGPVAHRSHVVTIHDVSPLEHPEWFSPAYARFFRTLVPAVAKSAKVVVTDSLFSRQRISELIGVDSVVAGAGLSDAFLEATPQTRDSTVVVFGGDDPRKNARRIVEAWPSVAASVPEAKLVVLGGARSSWVFAEGKTSDAQASAEVRNDLTDKELAAMLSRSGCAVFCSLYEGFGLPAIEAMAVGCPLVCSDIPPLREVADGVALFADPLSTAAISDAIVTCLSEQPHADSDASRDRAREHTWSGVAEHIADILDDLR